MADLIPKDTDEEMERYNEADMVRRARIPMDGNAALKYEADPVTGRENAYFPLSSGGYVKIGDRPVTPAQAAETDALAAERMMQNDTRGPISEVMGGAGGPTMDDYEAAGFTQEEVRAYEAERQSAAMSQPGTQVPVRLTPEQIQLGQEVGAPMLQPRATSMRDRVQDIIFTGLGGMIDDPNDLRFWSNYLTDVVDLTVPGVGGAMSMDEGARIFNQGFEQGNAVDMLVGGVLTTLGGAELVPIVKGLTEPARVALRDSLSPAAKNLLADAIGTTRAISQGDRDMLLEIFQPAGTPRSLGAAAPDEAISAFHGSPADFDRFDITKLGTGEGAQVYGRGLYFAESEDVAREYRDMLAPMNANIRSALRSAGGDFDTAIQNTKNLISYYEGLEPGRYRDGILNLNRQKLKELESQSQGNPPNPGRMYQVNIKANPEDFLNWDAPISEQPEKVREALMPFVEKRIAQMGEAGSRFSAEEWMGKLRGGDVMLLDKEGDAPVSQALAEAGVPGVKYFDQGSRAAGQGTRNYVVFDDALIDIVRKYGVAGLAIGAAVQSEMGIQDQTEGDA